tara:strand:- start:422 stop:916 length:495 start_codon:yes stop_codon:yes gene_type:complete
MMKRRRFWLARVTNAAPAAPAGGAFSQGKGRGCGFIPLIVAALPIFCASHVRATPVEVPSGQPVTLTEVLLDEAPGALWVRFRFVAPDIAQGGGRMDPAVATEDMDHLCTALALPYILHHNLAPARVVISLSDRPLDFGVSDAEATQFFEAYTPRDGACIWEEF